MIESYRNFFVASTGASAAFIGLLFVAVSFIDNERTAEKVKNWRRIMANSSFSQLVNIFFVSLAGLLPDAHNFAWAGCIMATSSMLLSIRLLTMTMDTDKTDRTSPSIIGVFAVGVYLLEFITAVGLIQNPDSKTLLSYFVLSILLLYAGALARAWEITGIKQR